MICLSKANEGTFRHLTFNQSPGPLAAEHTTRQDMNGISNLREHVAADQDDDSGGGLLDSADADEKWHHQGLSPGPGLSGGGAGRWFCGPSSRHQAAGGDDQPCLSVISHAWLSRLWGWITWTASVLLVSYLLTSYSSWSGQQPSTPQSEEALEPTQPSTPAKAQDSLVRDLRKRDSCASGGVSSDEYNTPLHVGALLIIWFTSALAASFPLLAKKFPGLHIPKRFFFFVRHFGTGVLIATAFVHLLPTAFISLGDPCLGGFWVNDYPAMPGAIALASIFFVTILEMVFHPSRKCTSIQVSSDQPDHRTTEDTDETAVDDDRPAMPMRDMQPPRARSSSVGHGLNSLPTVDEEAERIRFQAKGDPHRDSLGHPAVLSPEQKLRKERLQCVLLELGILFHSIFIGMALSVSVGNEFIILLIAIVFHQTFEGLALGSRISMVKWPEKNKYQPWLMAMAYGMTTPLGQAIGIATHTLYSPDSQIGLIVVGVMNSISAGLLTFASLVELMSEDFLSDESWQYLRGRRRVIACLFVFLGAFAMSLVGAWA